MGIDSKEFLRETVVVEGRDDESAVLAAVNANVICTHGFGIRPETLDLISTAYQAHGIIIFTDPDHAGERIRRRLTALYPDALQAFLTRDQAEKAGDIGIENACPADIIRALQSAGAGWRCRPGDPTAPDPGDAFTQADLVYYGLAGLPDSAARRSALGGALGIGSANAKTFCRRLNYMGITKAKVEALLSDLSLGPDEIV